MWPQHRLIRSQASVLLGDRSKRPTIQSHLCSQSIYCRITMPPSPHLLLLCYSFLNYLSWTLAGAWTFDLKGSSISAYPIIYLWHRFNIDCSCSSSWCIIVFYHVLIGSYGSFPFPLNIYMIFIFCCIMLA